MIALNAFGTFRADADELAERDVRAVSLAGEVGQHWQLMGRLAAEHLYVLDGDLKAQDGIAERHRGERQGLERGLRRSSRSWSPATRSSRACSSDADAWRTHLEQALELSRAETVDAVEDRDGSRELYTGTVAPATQALFEEMEKLQHVVEDERRTAPPPSCRPPPARARSCC